MNTKKFKRIIYLISITVLITVIIQVYRNVQNYQVNKERLALDMQQALDAGVESYYANVAKNNVVIFTSDTIDSTFHFNSRINRSAKQTMDTPIHLSSGHTTRRTRLKDLERSTYDSLEYAFFSSKTTIPDSINKINAEDIVSISMTSDFSSMDTLKDMRSLFKKVVFSLTNLSIDFENMDKYIVEELNRRNLDVEYVLWHHTPNSLFKSDDEANYELSTYSNSTFLPRNQQIEMKFENASLVILKRGMLDMLISLLIIGAVVGSLLYLYRIIAEQKELAEIKNDLISNITHEFKTPIATISTAIEGISNFNKTNDPEKTAKYLNISSGQLKKLNGMVEKLLETATLDSDDLELSLEPVEIVSFTQQVFERFQLLKGQKEMTFETTLADGIQEVDIFHLENVLSNLLDNALKYGGNLIRLKLAKEGDQMIWQVTDNGGLLDKSQQARIFDKFYRVPTGNVHDVRGFGIGLYYTKKIAEKHGGTIDLDVSNGQTTFTIKI